MSAPRLLFLTLLNDGGSDRIVAAMGRLGCDCAVLGPRGAFAACSRFATTLFPLPRVGGSWLRGLFVAAQLKRIVRTWQPDLVIPLDDFSARTLRSPQLRRAAGADAAALIERSLGAPNTYATICSREGVTAAAADLGLSTPRQAAVASLEAAKRAAAAFGYPVVLKREQTCGGFGVAIVPDEPSLEHAFRKAWRKAKAKRILQTMLGLGTADQSALVLQSYVSGAMAFRVVACAAGTVLDGVSFQAACIHPPVTGASTALQPIDRPDMDAAARTLVAALGCSGVVSLDFVLAADGACLIELNPRPVCSGHLGRLYGHDIYAALVAHLRGQEPVCSAEPVAGPATIALFPRELDRDPASPLLASSGVLHDVPWDDPGVLDAYASRRGRRPRPTRTAPCSRAPQRDAVPALTELFSAAASRANSPRSS